MPPRKKKGQADDLDGDNYVPADMEEKPAKSADDADQPAEMTDFQRGMAEAMAKYEAEQAKVKKPRAKTNRSGNRVLQDPENTGRTFMSGGDDGELVEIDIDDDKQWYVLHCYSGYENKVNNAIRQRIESMGMQDKIFDVLVPTEEEIEVHEGKRKTIERRVFPGYILVQMKMDEESWFVVRNTPGVTGFVGMANKPTPLRPEEVKQIINRMQAEPKRFNLEFKVGDKVRITDGPFNSFFGTVGEIDVERSKVRVMVSFFGRETPVELDFINVEKDVTTPTEPPARNRNSSGRDGSREGGRGRNSD